MTKSVLLAHGGLVVYLRKLAEVAEGWKLHRHVDVSVVRLPVLRRDRCKSEGSPEVRLYGVQLPCHEVDALMDADGVSCVAVC